MVKIIAEFCQNHNGDMDVLARMVEAAAEGGATHGKMQTIKVDTLTFRPQFEDGLTVDNIVKSIKRPYAPEYSRLKGLEVSDADTRRFVSLCKDNGLEPMTTCFARTHVEEIAQAGFESIKVASYDCASFPMLRELKAHFNEIIVSTGATFDTEIRHAADILAGIDYAFLHCVTLYPTPLDQMHLARMDWLRKFAPVVGFSDHSHVANDGIVGTKAAIAMGAEIIERHFTILEADQSRDGPVSINAGHLKELAEFCKLSQQEQQQKMDEQHPGWRTAIGNSERDLSDEELLNRDYYRGRFASPRPQSRNGNSMIYNFEETPLS